MHSGGRFRAGEFLIVGDGPGGQILPTTELVVFDRPGEIIPGSEANSILNRDAFLGSNPAPLFAYPQQTEAAPDIHIHMPLTVIGEPDQATLNRLQDEAEDVAQRVLTELGQRVSHRIRMHNV